MRSRLRHRQETHDLFFVFAKEVETIAIPISKEDKPRSVGWVMVVSGATAAAVITVRGPPDDILNCKFKPQCCGSVLFLG